MKTDHKLRVTIIGSGNWGSAAGKVIAENTIQDDLFEDEVRAWVFEEEWEGQKLSEIVNQKHENPKYLPGVQLPKNLKAVPDLLMAADQADLLVFVMPHQFVERACKTLAGTLKKDCMAISLIKGLLVVDGKPLLISQFITKNLGIACSVLSGANVAPDIAHEQFSETTIAYTSVEAGRIWQRLFDRPYFRVGCLPDIRGVETCGAVKNVIALAAGFVDGMGYGTNTKAAVIRLGVQELRLFCLLFGQEGGIVEETFFESAGWADVITTCFGGRHVRVASAFAAAKVAGKPRSWSALEDDMLKGMKLQGQLTCQEVHECLVSTNSLHMFPLFDTIYKIGFEDQDPKTIIDIFAKLPSRELVPHEDCTPSKPPMVLRSYRSTSSTS